MPHGAGGATRAGRRSCRSGGATIVEEVYEAKALKGSEMPPAESYLFVA